MLHSPVAQSTVTDVGDALAETRRRTLALVNSISDEDLERVHSTLMSPLVWDLGHIAAFEDLWLVHGTAGDRCCARVWPRSTTLSRPRGRPAGSLRSCVRAKPASISPRSASGRWR